jgi:DNA invertase Pin-like site-specific DNA recombinase
MIYGYARVSTGGQSPRNQVSDLTAAGCEKVVTETASGARDRPRLARLVAGLEAGDVLVVTRLDRLARTSLGLLEILREVSDRGAAFRSLVDHWADTSTPHGKLLLTVLGGLAEFERSLLIARTSEGRAAAVARGVKLGRKSSLSPVQRAWVAVQKRDGASTMDLARLFGVHHATINRVPTAGAGVKAPQLPPSEQMD